MTPKRHREGCGVSSCFLYAFGALIDPQNDPQMAPKLAPKRVDKTSSEKLTDLGWFSGRGGRSETIGNDRERSKTIGNDRKRSKTIGNDRKRSSRAMGVPWEGFCLGDDILTNEAL